MAITFDSIGNGGLQEKFNMALRQIGRNILDPNMDPVFKSLNKPHLVKEQ